MQQKIKKLVLVCLLCIGIVAAIVWAIQLIKK